MGLITKKQAESLGFKPVERFNNKVFRKEIAVLLSDLQLEFVELGICEVYFTIRCRVDMKNISSLLPKDKVTFKNVERICKALTLED